MHEDETLCSLKFGKEMAFKSLPSESAYQKYSISKVDLQIKQSQLENLKAKLSTLEPESFGKSASSAGIILFKENVDLLLKLEHHIKELKMKQKEAVILQRNKIVS